MADMWEQSAEHAKANAKGSTQRRKEKIEKGRTALSGGACFPIILSPKSPLRCAARGLLRPFVKHIYDFKKISFHLHRLVWCYPAEIINLF
jgi:hypothetical protein